jgi:putative membrane protein
MDLPLRRDPFAGLSPVASRVCFVLFLLQWILVWLRFWLPIPPLDNADWPEALLVVLASLTTLISLGRQLPAQNVLLAAAVIGFLAGTAQTLGAVTGIPFGPYHYTERCGPAFLHILPWPVPFIWVVAILNARGVARLVLRPWRQARNYGFWLIGVSVVLAVLFALGLEPFATVVKHYWTWEATRLRCDWYGAPCVNFFAWALTSLLILVFVTPALLNKSPVRHPPNYYPLAVWLLIQLLFLTGAAMRQLWPAVILNAVGCLLVGAFAMIPRKRSNARPAE